MELTETAEYFLKFGSLLGVILGLLSLFFWAYLVLLGVGPPYMIVNFYEILMVMASLGAIVVSYVLLTRFPQRLKMDPSRNALYLIGLGVLVAFGSWGIAGLLIVIGAVLILIDETS